MDIDTPEVILDRVFNATTQLPTEAPVLKELRTALAPHRGACLALEHLQSVLVIDKQRCLDEIEYLRGKIESIQVDIERSRKHSVEWEKHFLTTYNDIIKPEETTPVIEEVLKS